MTEYPNIKTKKIRCNKIASKQIKMILFTKFFPIVSGENVEKVDGLTVLAGAHG